jgi:hypothetical protein
MLVLAAIAAAIALTLGLTWARAAGGHKTIRGVIGGDYHAVASAGGDDWGAVASLRAAAFTGIRDADVAVVDTQAPGGVTSSDESDVECTGTYQNPTAPLDEVCIYISNADNAINVHGVSVFPGTASGSKYGFKIVWDTPNDDADTFVEAVWAYKKP